MQTISSRIGPQVHFPMTIVQQAPAMLCISNKNGILYDELPLENQSTDSNKWCFLLRPIENRNRCKESKISYQKKHNI